MTLKDLEAIEARRRYALEALVAPDERTWHALALVVQDDVPALIAALRQHLQRAARGNDHQGRAARSPL